MWYNDLLIILMGFMAVLLVVMSLVVVSRRGRAKKPIVVVEEKPEKVYVEKGFENSHEPVVSTENNPAEIEPIMTDEPPEDDSAPIDDIDAIPVEPIITEPTQIIEEPTPTEEPPEEAVITPTMPIIIEEPEPEEPVEIIETSDDVTITPVEPIIIETTIEPVEPENSKAPLEDKEISSIEPVLVDTDEQPFDIPEPGDDVVITQNQTFYTFEKEELPEESGVKEIPEVELPPLEPDEPDEIPEEIEPEPEPDLEPELEVPVVEERPYTRRLRKPVIDESDPNINVDLGVQTCPHCGEKVPDTIYCIICGKPLDPENTVGYDSEE